MTLGGCTIICHLEKPHSMRPAMSLNRLWSRAGKTVLTAHHRCRLNPFAQRPQILFQLSLTALPLCPLQSHDRVHTICHYSSGISSAMPLTPHPSYPFTTSIIYDLMPSQPWVPEHIFRSICPLSRPPLDNPRYPHHLQIAPPRKKWVSFQSLPLEHARCLRHKSQPVSHRR